MNVERPCGGVALVERLEVRQRHVDLAAHLEQRRRVVDPPRDLRDRAQVVRDVLADLAVAARRAALEASRRGRSARRRGRRSSARRRSGTRDPRSPRARDGARIRATQARSSSSERTFASDSIGWRWRTFSSRLTGAPPTRCVGESGVDELGVGGLDRDELAVERVVLLVADLGVVLDVVALRVVGELPRAARRRGPPDRPCALTSRAAVRDRARSSAAMPGRSVRSKCSGVSAIRPRATASRSVPGSSS